MPRESIEAAEAEEEIEVVANGFAFARARAWLAVAPALTRETFADVNEDAPRTVVRPTRLGLGAKVKSNGSVRETSNAGRALARSVLRAKEARERETSDGGENERSSASECDEDDRAKVFGRGRRGRGVYGARAGEAGEKRRRNG